MYSQRVFCRVDIHTTNTNYFALQEDPSENCCLGVFGLSLYTTEREIKEVFGRYGPLDNINVVHDHQVQYSFLSYRNDSLQT